MRQRDPLPRQARLRPRPDDRTEIRVDTRSGVKTLALHLEDGAVDSVTVGMGPARFARGALPMAGDPDEPFVGEPFEVDGRSFKATALSMGNPHLVLFVEEDPDDVDVRSIGPMVEHDERFPEQHERGVRRRPGRRREGPRLGARRRRDDGVRDGRLRRGRRGERGRPGAREGARAVPRRGPADRTAEDDEVLLTGPAERVFEGDVDPCLARGRSRMRVAKRDRDAAAVPVRRARQQARRQARRGRRRDLARRRRPRPADAGARRRGDARGRARPLDPPLPELLRGARVPAGGRRLVRPPLRRRARSRDRGHGADRLEGGDRAHRVRVRRPGRRGADPRPRLPGLRGVDAARRRHAGLAPDARGARASCPISTPHR